MDYPEKLELGTLTSEVAEAAERRPHLERISLLAEGGYRLRDMLPTFLTKRAGEEEVVYQNRLRKFSYSNVLGSAISQLTTKFSNGAIHLEGATPVSFWEEFRENNNGQGRTEKQLVSQIFSELLPYGQIFAHIDKPISDIEPQSAAEEEQLGLEPRVVLYSALQVLAWAEADDGSLRWVKICQIGESKESPTKAPISEAVWTFIDDEVVAKYRAFVKLKGGKICEILDADGETLDAAEDTVKIKLASVTSHNFGQIPIVRVALAPAMWSGNQAYPKAEESLLLECHRAHYLTSTYPQRTYKPFAMPDNNLDETFVDEDSGPLPTGLEYVLKLDNFSWVEPSGAILSEVKAALDDATNNIRSILAMGGAYDNTTIIEASGKSKEMDFENEASRLEAYGHIICDALQDIYQLVAIAKGYAPEAVAVSGLDDFSGERLENLISALTALLQIDFAKLQNILTPTLFLLIRERLMGYLIGNLTPAQKSAIADELKVVEELSDEPEPTPIPAPDDG